MPDPISWPGYGRVVPGGSVRRYFTQEVNPWPAIAGVAGAIAFLALAAMGRALLGVLVLIGVPLLWNTYERLRPIRTVVVEESAYLPHAADVVWNVVHPAENAPLLEAGIRHGYRVPGTPEGIGEQQAFVFVDGSMTVVEVIELSPGRRAVVRKISPPDVPQRTIFELVPTSDGCLYRQRVEVDVGKGKRLRPGFESHWQASTSAMFARLSSVLNQAPTRPPWPPPIPS